MDNKNIKNKQKLDKLYDLSMEDANNFKYYENGLELLGSKCRDLEKNNRVLYITNGILFVYSSLLTIYYIFVI